MFSVPNFPYTLSAFVYLSVLYFRKLYKLALDQSVCNTTNYQQYINHSYCPSRERVFDHPQSPNPTKLHFILDFDDYLSSLGQIKTFEFQSDSTAGLKTRSFNFSPSLFLIGRISFLVRRELRISSRQLRSSFFALIYNPRYEMPRTDPRTKVFPFLFDLPSRFDDLKLARLSVRAFSFYNFFPTFMQLQDKNSYVAMCFFFSMKFHVVVFYTPFFSSTFFARYRDSVSPLSRTETHSAEYYIFLTS